MHQGISLQISESKNNEIMKGTQTFRWRSNQNEQQKEKIQNENKREQEGTIAVNQSRATNKKKNEKFDPSQYVQNIINFSISILEEEAGFHCQTPNVTTTNSEQVQKQSITELNELESFKLPQTFPQQKQKTQKKQKNKKKLDQTLKLQKQAQKQQSELLIISPNMLAKNQQEKNKQQSLQSNKKKQFSFTQLENLDLQDQDAQFSHIGARSTTAGNSQSESDGFEEASTENSGQKNKYKKKINGDKQYPHSTQTTPIKRKQLNLNKSKVHDIEEFSNELHRKSYLNKARKKICLNRLHYLISLTFHLNIFPYGSFETGLDLEDSDVDIGIWGQQNLNYHQIVNFLQSLSSLLKQTPFLVNSKLIQSHMPILKLELNPKSQFYVDDPHIQQNWSAFNLDATDPGKIIQIDITWVHQWSNIYNNPHLGFASTTIVKDWLSRFAWYGDILLILKYLVKSKNLNDAYTGGISSFCLSIMLAAIYMIKHYTCSQQDKKQILLDFLKKYGTQFDPLKEGIYLDCYGQSHPFIPIEEVPQSPITIYSPVNYQIISQKATKFTEIQEEFKRLYEHLTKNNKIQDYFDQVTQLYI